MKQLPKEFTRNGWQFTQLKRSGNVAIYQRNKPDGSQLHLEVIIVQQGSARTLPDGRTIEASEFYPSDAQWGTKAWTFSPASHTGYLEKAFDRYNAISCKCR